MKHKKIVDLFPGKNVVRNEGKKYSDMLNDLIKPFENDFPDGMDIDDVIGFGCTVWNLACMSQSLPEKDYNKMLSSNPFPEQMGNILKKMIELKNKKFANYDRYIDDYVLEEKNGELVLTVLTTEKEAFMNKIMSEVPDFQPEKADFEEAYINRTAIVVKPLQAFFDWLNELCPEDAINEVSEVNVYLIDDNIEYIEKWLKINFDGIFKMELEGWHTDKKKWPKKRSYKMFRQWFSVDISTMVYDMEKNPVYKELL